MLVNFYGVSRIIWSIWDIGMVSEGLYTHIANSVVSPQNPGGAGRKMKHNFLGFAPWFPVFKRSRSDGINLIFWNILRCSGKNKDKNGSNATRPPGLVCPSSVVLLSGQWGFKLSQASVPDCCGNCALWGALILQSYAYELACSQLHAHSLAKVRQKDWPCFPERKNF